MPVHADAIEAALPESVATKSDIAAVKSDIAEVKHQIALSVRYMTIRMGAIAVALFAVGDYQVFFPRRGHAVPDFASRNPGYDSGFHPVRLC